VLSVVYLGLSFELRTKFLCKRRQLWSVGSG